jgi:hypothetical protein
MFHGRNSSFDSTLRKAWLNLRSTGAADRTFSNQFILSPVDRGAKMPAVLSFRVDVYIWRMSALRAKPDANVSLDHLAGDQGRRGEHRSARCGRLSRFIINCTSRYR